MRDSPIWRPESGDRPPPGEGFAGQGEKARQPLIVPGEPAEGLDGHLRRVVTAPGRPAFLQATHQQGFPFVNVSEIGSQISYARLCLAGRCLDLEADMAKTVLIVEDNELNMKLFNDLLESRGCRIIQTRNGVEAVELARKHRPDLILMDIQLPEVSGLQVTQWLKDDEELRAIPVVAVTAFAMKGDEEKIRQGGCEAYLSKPISVVKFFETIDVFLRDQ
jgi:two-component system cell cycle response regulator DivK